MTVNWTPLGIPFQMRFDYRRLFMGTRIALFNYSTNSDGGYVDYDFFYYNRQDSHSGNQLAEY